MTSSDQPHLFRIRPVGIWMGSQPSRQQGATVFRATVLGQARLTRSHPRCLTQPRGTGLCSTSCVGVTKPLRIRLSRRKGFRLQAASRDVNGLLAVKVARPGRWGNPFVIGRHGSQASCVQRYRGWLVQPAQEALLKTARSALRGKNLACWCEIGTPCHADVLLALVN